MYCLILRRPEYRETYDLRAGRRWDAELLARVLRFGSPNGLQMLLEVAAFTLFILLVGRLGEDAMAATTLAFNVNTMAWVPMLGLSIAVSTMVGQQVGRGLPERAARAAWTGFWMAIAYMGLMASLYVLVPDLFLLGHASGTPAERFAALRDLTVVLLRFVAAYCLFDAMNLIFAAAIKGAGDMRFVLLTTLLTAPFPVAASWLGMACGGGLLWCWTAVTLWVCLLGLIYLTRFLHGRWRQMRVIEPDLTAAE